MAPLIGNVGDWALDLSRTTLVVTSQSGKKAASVPKIFFHSGSSYLWFDYFRTDEGYIEARGIKIQRHGDVGSGVYWADGHTDSMDIDDSSAITVWQPSGDDNSIADVFAIEPTDDDHHLFVFAGIGGNGCSAPSSDVPHCYRVA